MANAWNRQDSTAILRDGSPVTNRPIRRDDAAALLAFHARLSPRSRYLRFLSPVPRLAPEHLHRLVEVDDAGGMAVVARRDGQIVGAAHCYRFESSARGDVSVAVDDRYQRQGLGPLLLERLVRLARDRGISVLEADVLAENRRMLGILARAHLPMTSALDMGVVHVEIFLEER